MKSLRYRIGVSYIALVLITIAISAFAVYHFSELGRSVGRILRENYRSVLAAENMVKALERQENAQLAMQMGTYDQGLADFLRSQDQFFHWYGEALVGSALPEEPAILDRIETAYDAYLAASDTLHRMIEAGGGARVARYHADVVRPLAARLRSHNFDLLEVNQNAMLRTERHVEAAAGAATTAVIAVSAVAILLSILASVRFARGIVGPIDHITRTVRQMGEGHLNQHFAVTTDDEIAELGHEFNRMTERLLAHEAMNVQQLDRMKSEFVATVSHELRTPLTSLGMALDLLMQGVAGGVTEMQRDLLETARSDSDRLRKLITDLLYLVRLESGVDRRPAEGEPHVVVERDEAGRGAHLDRFPP